METYLFGMFICKSGLNSVCFHEYEVKFEYRYRIVREKVHRNILHSKAVEKCKS